MKLPETIDGVVERLSKIIERSIEDDSRLGYFAALYNRVTQRVREGVKNCEFEDNERMEQLDVVFANRYLAAYDAYHAGEAPSRCWLLSFEKARSPHPIVLQHLLLGMNAHIHLDLGVAAARTCPGKELMGLMGDFEKINEVLASLAPEVEQELSEVSPVFGKLTKLVASDQKKILDFSMSKAREDAWHFACTLASLPKDEQAAQIAHRDRSTVEIGEALLHLGPAASLVRLHESLDVADNIRKLATGEFEHLPR